MAIPMDSNEWALVAKNRPVDAVKAYRERTGVSLSEAYHVIKGTVREDAPSYLGTLASALGRPEVMAQLARPATPAFGGYVAVPNAHADGSLYAYWTDGRLAGWNAVTQSWQAVPSPDYATLFPASVPAPFVTAPTNPTVGEGPRPEADQPRPDDADDTEYPRTRRGRDD
jgi:hypothetical protein